MLWSEIDKEELPMVMDPVTNGERQSKEAPPWLWVVIRERAWGLIDQGKRNRYLWWQWLAMS